MLVRRNTPYTIALEQLAMTLEIPDYVCRSDRDRCSITNRKLRRSLIVTFHEHTLRIDRPDQ